MNSIAADLMLSGSYLNALQDSMALDVLDSIPDWHDLPQDRHDDIERVHEIYTIIERNTPDELVTADVDSIRSIGNESYKGAAWAISRALLLLYDEHFEPLYFVPDTSSRRPGFSPVPKGIPNSIATPTIYPNPAQGTFVVQVPSETSGTLEFELVSTLGETIFRRTILPGLNAMTLNSDVTDRVLFYRIFKDEHLWTSGKLLLLRKSP